jgi:hypothetical protein
LELGEKAQMIALEMEQWQGHNPDRVKLPD